MLLSVFSSPSFEAFADHQTRRIPHLRTLSAVAEFAKGNYQSAVESFLINNINPAFVVSLYTAETISGRLHVPKDQWMELFGAIPGTKLEPDQLAAVKTSEAGMGKTLMKAVSGVTGRQVGKKASTDSLRSAAAKSAKAEVNEKVTSDQDDTGAHPSRLWTKCKLTGQVQELLLRLSCIIYPIDVKSLREL